MAASFYLQKDAARLKRKAQDMCTNLLINNLVDLYSCQSIDVASETTQTIVLHIPLGRPEEKLELYSFTPTPILVDDILVDDSLTIQIDSQEHMLAVSKEGLIQPARHSAVPENWEYLCQQLWIHLENLQL